MASVSIKTYRSDSWLRAERLSTSERVPESICTDYVLSDMAIEARAVLLEVGNGEYAEHVGDIHACSIVVDSDSPTAAEVSAAIVRLYAEIPADRKIEAAKAGRRHY